MAYFFEFDLETGKIGKNTCPHYAVRYYKTEVGIFVEIGYGYRHEIFIDGKYWNIILKMIKELDTKQVEALIKGLMRAALDDELAEKFVTAVKNGKIKEIADLA